MLKKADHPGNAGSINCPAASGLGSRENSRGRKFKGAVLLFRTAGMLVAFAIGAASLAPASAQAPYPIRPIHIVVPFGPGGLLYGFQALH
jgi:hypothetical protein